MKNATHSIGTMEKHLIMHTSITLNLKNIWTIWYELETFTQKLKNKQHFFYSSC